MGWERPIALRTKWWLLGISCGSQIFRARLDCSAEMLAGMGESDYLELLHDCQSADRAVARVAIEAIYDLDRELVERCFVKASIREDQREDLVQDVWRVFIGKVQDGYVRADPDGLLGPRASVQRFLGWLSKTRIADHWRSVERASKAAASGRSSQDMIETLLEDGSASKDLIETWLVRLGPNQRSLAEFVRSFWEREGGVPSQREMAAFITESTGRPSSVSYAAGLWKACVLHLEALMRGGDEGQLDLSGM